MEIDLILAFFFGMLIGALVIKNAAVRAGKKAAYETLGMKP